MQTVEVMLVVLVAVAGVACGFAVWAFIEMAKAMRSMSVLAEQTRERLNPVLEKADVTVDAVNAELLRIDGIITQFEDAGSRVSSASGAISDLVHAPSEIVTGVASRVKRAWRSRHHEQDGADAVMEEQVGAADETTQVP